MNTHRFQRFLVGLGVLGALLAIDHVIFMLVFNVPHLKWYLVTGAAISFVSSLVSQTAKDLEERPELISSNPRNYFAAQLQLAGVLIFIWGTSLRSNSGEGQGTLIDRLLALPFWLALSIGLCLWLVVIVPPQYFLYLICGAPARTLLQAKQQAIMQFDGSQLRVDTVDAAVRPPMDWLRLSISQKPVAMTALFASLFLLLIRPLIG